MSTTEAQETKNANKVSSQSAVLTYSLALLVLGLAAAAAIYGSAAFAGPWVRGLAEDIGEIQALRARKLAKAGRLEQAVAYYRKALAVPFDDRRQQGYALRNLGHLLIELDRPVEAIDPLQAAVELFPDDGRARLALCDALGRSERWRAMARAATKWRDYALQHGSRAEEVRANYNLGRAYEEMGRTDKAIEAYRAAFAEDPTSVSGYHLGVLLAQHGHEQEAAKTLKRFTQTGQGWRLRKAEQWLSEEGG